MFDVLVCSSDYFKVLMDVLQLLSTSCTADVNVREVEGGGSKTEHRARRVSCHAPVATLGH